MDLAPKPKAVPALATVRTKPSGPVWMGKPRPHGRSLSELPFGAIKAKRGRGEEECLRVGDQCTAAQKILMAAGDGVIAGVPVRQKLSDLALRTLFDIGPTRIKCGCARGDTLDGSVVVPSSPGPALPQPNPRLHAPPPFGHGVAHGSQE